MKTKDTDLIAGAAAGLIGGIFASFIMEQFQALWTKAASAASDDEKNSESTPATVKAANAISQKVVGHNVPKASQERAGEAIHYAVGAASGTIYGAAVELVPFVSVGHGAAFGSAVFVLADEVSVPALGFSKPPTEIPVASHVYALASHLVYGWTTELVRAAVRRAIG